MPDRFVSLAQYLRKVEPVEPRTGNDDDVREIAPDVEGESNHESMRVIHAALRAGAALADALEMLRADLMRDLACDVLGRELQLAPCDIATIVAKALARCTAELPIAVHVHPDDVGALEGCPIAVVANAGLRRGDLRLDVRNGTIDVTLGARLAEVLAVRTEA